MRGHDSDAPGHLDEGALAAQIHDFGMAMIPENGTPDPDRVVRVAATALPSLHHCGITMLRSNARPSTLASTGEVPRVVDALQFEVGEGPCITASQDNELVTLSPDVSVDRRWPAFGARCHEETGVRSILAVRLKLSGGDHAAINFYSEDVAAFGVDDIAIASLLAPFAALAVEHTLRQEDATNLRAALTSSRQIGTAIGILMASELVTSDQAFDLLRSASQELNRKVRDVAAEVEQTGELPGQRSPDAGGRPA